MRQFERLDYLVMAGNNRITWNDRWHSIDINRITIRLSPTQYRICSLFLTHSTTIPSVIGEEFLILAYCSQQDLQHEIEVPSRRLLTKHISLLNGRLNVYGLHISPFHRGYALAFSILMKGVNV